MTDLRLSSGGPSGNSTRWRLPNRRFSETFAFECGRFRYTATISRFSDGKLAEIFISNHKTGSDADTIAKDSAVVCSLALQHGVPLETIRRALLRGFNIDLWHKVLTLPLSSADGGIAPAGLRR